LVGWLGGSLGWCGREGVVVMCGLAALRAEARCGALAASLAGGSELIVGGELREGRAGVEGPGRGEAAWSGDGCGCGG